MTSVTYPSRRSMKTGRQLGWQDVFVKIAENTAISLRSLVGNPFARRPVDPATQRTLEAAFVRRLADSQRDSSPAFAADLYVAADRHELIG